MSDHLIKSRPFDAPFVRVRGRMSREGEVTWSPCLRTFHPPNWVKYDQGKTHLKEPAISAIADALSVEVPAQAGVPNPHYDVIVGSSPDVPTENPLLPDDSGGNVIISVPEWAGSYEIVFQDARGEVLARAPVRIRFFAPGRQWALFTQRLPYHRDTHRVVLERGKRELGALVVPKRSPDFVLRRPTTSDAVDVNGVLHLRWGIEDHEEAYVKRNPITCYVRYCGDGGHWYRPGVNITDYSFDLDLREMPGGDRCVAQVIATNGYQTSYVETPPFAVPRKPPEILLATPRGPILFAQGFSREEGPLLRESIVWLADGRREVGTGASFDVRSLRARLCTLAVRVTDSRGAITVQYLGWYDGKSGLQVSQPGY